MIVATDRLQNALDAHLAGDLRKAESLYKKLLQTQPGNARACYLLGTLYAHQSQNGLAAAMLRRAVTLDPHLSEAHNNLGRVLQDTGDIAAAEASYIQAVTLNPASPEFACNLATTRELQGDSATALALYDNVVARLPDYADAHWNRALILLKSGDFEQGWRDFEWRFAATGVPARRLSVPQWNGEALQEKTIFVHAEQGYGDTFQFVRYLPWLKSLGARVVFECHDGMKTILEECAGFDTLVDWSEHWAEAHIHEIDFHIPLLSLPGLAHTASQSHLAKISYVKASASKEKYWRERLSGISHGVRRIGIVWAGSPNHNNDANRSCHLTDLAPLLAREDAQFISLQLGPAAAQIAAHSDSAKIWDLSSELKDYAETAGVIANLDLVIAVDTSVAHLAGAMGKPVWTLLAHRTCWRWIKGREDTQWYPTMRLFRQQTPGDWASVAQNAAQALAGAISI